MKYLVLAASSLLVVLVQMIGGRLLFLFHFLDLSLLLVAYWALYRNRMEALFAGSITGVLLDAFLGWPLGYNGFGKTLAAFAVGQASKHFNMSGRGIRFVVVGAASCLGSTSVFVLLLALQRSTDSLFLGAALVQAIFTGGVAVAVFAGIDSFASARADRVG